MRYVKSPLRLGMTAVAAALALSSTPLFAQDASLAEPAPPIVAAPPPAPVTAEPVQAAPAAPAAALNIPQITVNMDDAPKETTEAATPVAQQRTSEASVTPSRPATRAQAAPAPEPAAQPAAPVESTQALPVAAEPAPPPVTAMAPPPVAVAPVAPSPSSETRNVEADEVLPIAGGVLGVLVLMGGAFAVASRKRRYRDVPETVAADEPLVLAEPIIERPIAARVPIAASTAAIPAANLPAGFDLSRFGRHVQAAYRGPTPDNPSLSLGKRLKRARFYDQRERMASNRAAQPAMSTVAQPAPAARPERTAEYVTSRRLGGGNVGFRPAFQS